MLKFPVIDPVAISLGPLKVRWYGLMYFVGFTLAWLLGRYRAQKTQAPGYGGVVWTSEQVVDLITYCIVGLILGARFGYTLFYDAAFFLENPLEIFKIWRGGMSFHGGALGLAVSIWLFGRKTGKTFGQISDFLTPLAPPGLLAGRMGNFINGELWGRVTDVPWAMVFPGAAAGGVPRHPSQLYEALLEGALLFIILWWYSSKPRPRWTVSGLFLLGYGVFRFFVEFFREPDAHLGFVLMDWMSMGQVLCVPMMLIGAIMLVYGFRKNQV